MGGCFPDASGADVCPFPEKLTQLSSFFVPGSPIADPTSGGFQPQTRFEH